MFHRGKVLELVSGFDGWFVSSAEYSHADIPPFHFWQVSEIQTNSVWLSPQSSQHLLKMSVRNEQAHPLVTIVTMNVFKLRFNYLTETSTAQFVKITVTAPNVLVVSKKIVFETLEMSYWQI